METKNQNDLAIGLDENITNFLKECGRKRAHEVLSVLRTAYSLDLEGIEEYLPIWIGLWEKAAIRIWLNETHDHGVSSTTWLRYMRQVNEEWIRDIDQPLSTTRQVVSAAGEVTRG